ncbi:hypothetical protein HON71_02720 [Candidatus Woesearchaeota archaeon]|jgi:hypothetical protein|nr:hypothetical protein [Candidatus Woesearchaeota archaeon]MBT5341983.1 hypothetical protein [Candidatus Woesearchaeota archaeon]
MAIEERLNIEDHFLKLIDNVETCFSRMDKERYSWVKIEDELGQVYNNLSESVQEKYGESYLNAMSLIESAKDFKHEK